MASQEQILDGITVIDASTFVTGGFASAMLANQGADVIKIERPEVGDDIRHSGPPFIDNDSPYFWTVNYGKRSMELNLKSESGLEILYDLIADSDVFIQNFRPGTADRLGVGYDDLAKQNPELIYCDISAFGKSGPWKNRPGYDLLIQGMSGVMSVTGEEGGDPVKVGLPLTDLITAMWATFGISNALYKRALTEEGEYLELGMLDATLPWLTKQAGKVFAGEEPQRMGTKDPVLAPYQTFETADGHINIACLNQKLWREFCTAINAEELRDDERFKTNADRVEHADQLEQEIELRLQERSTEEWMEILVEEAGIPAGPIFSVEEALHNEQIQSRGVLKEIEDGDRTIPVIEHPINYKYADSGFDQSPPDLGEHSEAILRDLGYSTEQITMLEENGVI